MSNRLIDPMIRFIIRGLLSYRVTVGQPEGRINEKPELFIAVERLNEADFPDGTQTILHVQGYNQESLKNRDGNFAVGDLFNHKDGWSPKVFMKNETVKDIRDLLRHWQENKDDDARAFVTISVSEVPERAEQDTHILITEVQFTIQMPERHRQQESI